jgi:hypothetical protein
MQYQLSLLAALAVAGVNAMPNNILARQGVTAKISPSAAAPSGCSQTYSGSFGIAVMNVTAASPAASMTSESSSSHA